MSRVDPVAYRWISGSELEVAGCVTLVPEAGVVAVAELFGHEVRTAATGDQTASEDGASFGARVEQEGSGSEGDQIWVSALPAATLVVEDNGHQGARTEVLREVSRAGPSKLAASLFWNVNGIVMVTCARRGKVVASIDLSYVEEDDLAEVPRVLRPLARLCTSDEVDLIAVGAAMIERYTGVGFTRGDVEAATALPIVPRPADLRTYQRGPEQGALDSDLADLGDIGASMTDEELRALAEWCAAAAVREAGLADDVVVRQVQSQFGSGEPTSLSPGLDALRRRYAAETQRLQRIADESYEENVTGALALDHARLPENALEALRSTSHSDAFSAAVGALSSAARTFRCTRLERGARFVDDERGRRLEDFDSHPRVEQFTDVVRQVITHPAPWPALAHLLPEPLTAAALGAAADVDRRMQQAGAFDTWQTSAASSEASAFRRTFSEHLDHETRVRARYLALEERERAIAARGPIAAGARDPINPGGFAVTFADGLRVERLPAGRAAGNLYLTYVFTHEFGFDDGARSGTAPFERISCRGPEGVLRAGGGGGSGNGTTMTWHTQLEIEGLAWIQLDYREDKATVATEKIRLD